MCSAHRPSASAGDALDVGGRLMTALSGNALGREYCAVASRRRVTGIGTHALPHPKSPSWPKSGCDRCEPESVGVSEACRKDLGVVPLAKQRPRVGCRMCRGPG